MMNNLDPLVLGAELREEIREGMELLMDPLALLDQFQEGDNEEDVPVGRIENTGNGARTEKSPPDDEPSEIILTAKGTEMKGLQCMVCYECFNITNRIPKIFPCGHSFCYMCVKGLISNKNYLTSSVSCPTCRQNTRFTTSSDPSKVPTNYCLLSMLEQRKEENNSETIDREKLTCKECGASYNGENLTMCNEEECQMKVPETISTDVDEIKRPKGSLLCKSCINDKHSRHNYTPFAKVVAQYEANQRIMAAEEILNKELKHVDSLLVKMGNTRTEILEHRRRMMHAIANIRDEADHPQIYGYLTRYVEAVQSSGIMFKGLINNLNTFEAHSKSRYYRAFGTDCLRPITYSTPDSGPVQPKPEPTDKDQTRANLREALRAHREMFERDRGGIIQLPAAGNVAPPVPQLVPQPVQQPIPQPVPQPIPQPIAQQILQPVPQQIPEPNPQPIPQPVPQPIPQQVLQPIPQQIPQPIPQPIPHQIARPIPLPLPQPIAIPIQLPLPPLFPAQFAGAQQPALPQVPPRAFLFAADQFADQFADMFGRQRQRIGGQPFLRRNRRDNRAQQNRVLLQEMNEAMVLNPILADIPAVLNVMEALVNNNVVHEAEMPRRRRIEFEDAIENEIAQVEVHMRAMRENVGRMNRQMRDLDVLAEQPIPDVPLPEGADPLLGRRQHAERLVFRVRDMHNANERAEAHNPDPAARPQLDEIFVNVGNENFVGRIGEMELNALEPVIARLRELEADYIRRAAERRRIVAEQMRGDPLMVFRRNAQQAAADGVPAVPAEPVVAEQPPQPVEAQDRRRPASPNAADQPAAKRERQD